MSEQSQHLNTIQDIRQLMEKSSRFISLSGLSGVAAGFCALAAAWVTQDRLNLYRSGFGRDVQEVDLQHATRGGYSFHAGYQSLERELLMIAVITFAASFSLSFLFTYLRSKKTGVPIWGFTARKVMMSVIVPMIAGGIVILRLLDLQVYGLLAPCCLVFYGLGLINAGKYTFAEIRYLGYVQLALGLCNLWLPGYGLFFWAMGFGVLHIIYGFVMWWKHERGYAPVN